MEYKIQGFKHTPPTANDCYAHLAEMSYESPIEVIQGNLRMQFENEVMTAIQEQQIFVDKEELIKALQYDRNQYTKGFIDGCKNNTYELCQQVRADTVRKMHSEIKDRCIKGGIYPAFVARTIDQIAKEMLEDNT